MKRLNQILGGALAVQVLLVAAAWWPRESSTIDAHPMLSIDPASVSVVTLTSPPPKGGEPPEPLVLERAEGHWTLASEGGYPADDTKVDEMLGKVLDVEVRAPIATQKTSHNALRVGETEFGVRVSLQTADGNTTELVVGAASNDTAHLRLADSDDVYLGRGLSAFSLSTAARTYWNPEILAVEVDSLSTLSVVNANGRIELAKKEGVWASAAVPEGMQLDQEAIASFAGKLLKLRMKEPVGREAPAAAALDGGTRVEWTVESEDRTDSGGYTVGAEDSGDAFVRLDGRDWVVKVRASAFNDLRKARIEDWLEPSSPAASGSEGEAPGVP